MWHCFSISLILGKYTASVGGCNTNTGYKMRMNRDCMLECDEKADCTAYTLPTDGSEWCEMVTGVGTTGNGKNDGIICYVKKSGVVDTTPGKLY